MKQRKTTQTRSIEPIKTVDNNGVTKTTTFTTTSTTIYNEPTSTSTPPSSYPLLSTDPTADPSSDLRYSSFSSQPRLKQSAQSGFLSAFSGKSEFVFQALILGAICILAFMCRLFSVVRYESVIHEFDPWFNFRTTRYLVAEGFYNFHNWYRTPPPARNTDPFPTLTCTRTHPPRLLSLGCAFAGSMRAAGTRWVVSLVVRCIPV